MRIATTASVALLALSTAALAQVAGSPPPGNSMSNNMMSPSDTPMNSDMPMNNTMSPDNGMTPPGE